MNPGKLILACRNQAKGEEALKCEALFQWISANITKLNLRGISNSIDYRMHNFGIVDFRSRRFHFHIILR